VVFLLRPVGKAEFLLKQKPSWSTTFPSLHQLQLSMALIFVTGISTSGKSSIAKELIIRGYEAYDTEHEGRSAWYSKKTGRRVAEFGQAPERTKEWLDQHEWLISTDWVVEMINKAKDKNVFLCGGSANESEVREICQKVIWLKTNEPTIRQRVNNSRDHTYGTKSHELSLIISGNKQKEIEYKNYGAIVLDATQPLNKVVDKIISIC
jgi:shikimate kinase